MVVAGRSGLYIQRETGNGKRRVEYLERTGDWSPYDTVSWGGMDRLLVPRFTREGRSVVLTRAGRGCVVPWARLLNAPA